MLAHDLQCHGGADITRRDKSLDGVHSLYWRVIMSIHEMKPMYLQVHGYGWLLPPFRPFLLSTLDARRRGCHCDCTRDTLCIGSCPSNHDFVVFTTVLICKQVSLTCGICIMACLWTILVALANWIRRTVYPSMGHG